jgi:hypothetical protein
LQSKKPVVKIFYKPQVINNKICNRIFSEPIYTPTAVDLAKTVKIVKIKYLLKTLKNVKSEYCFCIEELQVEIRALRILPYLFAPKVLKTGKGSWKPSSLEQSKGFILWINVSIGEKYLHLFFYYKNLKVLVFMSYYARAILLNTLRVLLYFGEYRI